MPNENIILILKKLSNQYKNDISLKWKKRALDKAIKEIKNYQVQIISGENAKKNVKYIGKGIAQRIDEILETGGLAELIDVIKQRSNDKPEGSYTVELLKEGTGRVAQKIVEEAGETAIASVNQTLDDVANEMGDLLYHCMVLLVSLDIPAEQVWEVLAKRRG